MEYERVIRSLYSCAGPGGFAIDELVPLRVLGRGASGVVHLALHLPTMTLVAQKNIGVFEQGLRHQFVKVS